MWKDITTYSRGATERKPMTFELRAGPFRLIITSGHIHYPGRFIATCHSVFEGADLATDDLETAKTRAGALLRSHLAPALAQLAEAGL